MSEYVEADGQIATVVEELVAEYHERHKLPPGLITVRALLAYSALDRNGEPKGPAIKHNGYPAAAQVKILSAKNRVLAACDVVIELDGHYAGKWSEQELRAVIFHELCHLEFKKVEEETGAVKLAMRLHDYQFGWFDDAARVYGRDSMEVKQALEFYRGRRQLYLPGLEPEGPETVAEAVLQEA